jgi:hypothetical protein
MQLGIPMSGLQLALRGGLAAGLSIAIAQFFKLESDLRLHCRRHRHRPRPDAKWITWLHSPCRYRGRGASRGCTERRVSSRSCDGGVSIVLAMLVCHLIRAPEGAKVAGYICGLVVFEHASAPFHSAFFRLIDTVLGVTVAWDYRLRAEADPHRASEPLTR